MMPTLTSLAYGVGFVLLVALAWVGWQVMRRWWKWEKIRRWNREFHAKRFFRWGGDG